MTRPKQEKPKKSVRLHPIVPELLEGRVSVALVGCGGNGSQILSGLARLHLGMIARGHPAGLHVTVFDPDRVSPANVGRQLFSPSDIGQYKASVLVNRLNLFYGLDWEAVPALFEDAKLAMDGNGWSNLYARRFILISAVDTAAARATLHRRIYDPKQQTPAYWLDMANGQTDGHVIFGQPAIYPKNAKGKMNPPLLYRPPVVTEVYPELLDDDFVEDNTPSCSLAEALETQGLFVNQHMATWALTLLELLFWRGGLDHHGYHINLLTGCVNPRPIPETWPFPAVAKAKEAAYV